MGLYDIQKFYSSKETRYLTHDFHPYPNKFIPQIVGALIKEYSKENDVVLDPFCGSGTILIEANLLKRNAIGIDINPLACLISGVKTTPLEINKLKDVTKTLLDDLYFNLEREGNLNDFAGKINPKIPEFSKRDYWFQENALFGLAILKELINKIEDINIKNFCLVAFSSIIKDVSDASSLYRFTKSKKPKKISRLDVLHKFGNKINQRIRALDEYNQKYNPNFIKIYQKDSRYLRNTEYENRLLEDSEQLVLDAFKSPKEEQEMFSNNSIDFIITNPPKFGFDFYRCFGIYFWWLDFDIKELNKTMMEGKKINSKLINLNIKNPRFLWLKDSSKEFLNIDFADELINKVREKKNCVGIALLKYYYDIRQVLAQIHKLLKEGKYCCICASDYVLYGSPMRCPDTIIELAKQVGFKLDKRVTRIIPKKVLIFAKQDKIEEFLIFKK